MRAAEQSLFVRSGLECQTFSLCGLKAPSIYVGGKGLWIYPEKEGESFSGLRTGTFEYRRGK